MPPPQLHGCRARGGREANGAWPWGAGRETCWAPSWQGVATSGPGGPEQRSAPTSVPTAPSWPWERGLVRLPQLFGGREGPSQGWGRNCFLLCVRLGWKKREAGGEPGRAGFPRSRDHGPLAQLLWPAVLLPLFGENRLGRGWGSPLEACRVLKPPYPVHSRQLRASHSPQLLGPQRQPSLCHCLALPPGHGP